MLTISNVFIETEKAILGMECGIECYFIDLTPFLNMFVVHSIALALDKNTLFISLASCLFVFDTSSRISQGLRTGQTLLSGTLSYETGYMYMHQRHLAWILFLYHTGYTIQKLTEASSNAMSL